MSAINTKLEKSIIEHSHARPNNVVTILTFARLLCLIIIIIINTITIVIRYPGFSVPLVCVCTLENLFLRVLLVIGIRFVLALVSLQLWLPFKTPLSPIYLLPLPFQLYMYIFNNGKRVWIPLLVQLIKWNLCCWHWTKNLSNPISPWIVSRWTCKKISGELYNRFSSSNVFWIFTDFMNIWLGLYV